jgi:hypothetical protein
VRLTPSRRRFLCRSQQERTDWRHVESATTTSSFFSSVSACWRGLYAHFDHHPIQSPAASPLSASTSSCQFAASLQAACSSHSMGICSSCLGGRRPSESDVSVTLLQPIRSATKVVLSLISLAAVGHVAPPQRPIPAKLRHQQWLAPRPPARSRRAASTARDAGANMR